MTQLAVFDPAQCCPTGVCGSDVDPKLTRLAADLEWLKGEGVEVLRYNLSQQPKDFVEHAEVNALLKAQGESVLPVFVVDGRVVGQGEYPERERLAAWTGIEAKETRAEASGCCGSCG